MKKLDVRGEVCPYPMMLAVQAMQKNADGDEIVVVTDHPPTLETIPPQAARLGYSYEQEETGSPEWTITLRPGGATR